MLAAAGFAGFKFGEKVVKPALDDSLGVDKSAGLSDFIGKNTDRVKSLFGSKEAKERLRVQEEFQATGFGTQPNTLSETTPPRNFGAGNLELAETTRKQLKEAERRKKLEPVVFTEREKKLLESVRLSESSSSQDL